VLKIESSGNHLRNYLMMKPRRCFEAKWTNGYRSKRWELSHLSWEIFNGHFTAANGKLKYIPGINRQQSRQSSLMNRFLLTGVSTSQNKVKLQEDNRQVSAYIDHTWHWHTHTVDIATGKNRHVIRCIRGNYRPQVTQNKRFLPQTFLYRT
jgi:hypothetical protein